MHSPIKVEKRSFIDFMNHQHFGEQANATETVFESVRNLQKPYKMSRYTYLNFLTDSVLPFYCSIEKLYTKSIFKTKHYVILLDLMKTNDGLLV